jgi:dienelactone hydrolase
MSINSGSHPYLVNGRSFAGFLADGSQGRQVPGILVVHEGRGFTRHPRDRALLLAEMGYVAFAPDYLGEPANSLEHAFSMMRPFSDNRGLYRDHGSAALDVLRRHPCVDPARLGAIGFCWGGYAVLELACVADLRCVVGFHPGLSLGPLSNPSNISAKTLICVGDQDPYVPMKDITAFIAQMNQGKVDCQILLLLGAPHSFTNPEPYAYETGTSNVGYDAVADRRSWAAMRNLFLEAMHESE